MAAVGTLAADEVSVRTVPPTRFQPSLTYGTNVPTPPPNGAHAFVVSALVVKVAVAASCAEGGTATAATKLNELHSKMRSRSSGRSDDFTTLTVTVACGWSPTTTEMSWKYAGSSASPCLTIFPLIWKNTRHVYVPAEVGATLTVSVKSTEFPPCTVALIGTNLTDSGPGTPETLH